MDVEPFNDQSVDDLHLDESCMALVDIPAGAS